MDWFSGWKKIYLFYGVIFFCLGALGGYLRAPDGQNELGRGLHSLVADLRSYLTPDSAESSPVLSEAVSPAALAVTFFYPEGWQAQSPEVVRQLQRLLSRHFTSMEMQAVSNKVDFDAWFATQVVKYPGQVLAGVAKVDNQAEGIVAYLWWRTLQAPSLTLLAERLYFLPQEVRIAVKLQQSSGFLSEVSWEESGQNLTNLPLVISVWADTINATLRKATGDQPL